ncbi:LysR family transcriptional regulator [Parahaliea sp. F7430]|uniref:LysR family transcriptional regulator n=1 Tax=Sediminihaliea albiluteola TaxID=2758564 RepID=A0A7W2TWX5_9GAMM|nr:LysR family transcriptional regulator [Sediminihaliea albiluteola]MBA6413428.1 LysR family transcriptional regulator [Sediminihaliea albiluteola]
MHKTTLEQWRMFKAVVDEGGFNQAASKIHKSTSSIHHAVSKLEDTLGVKLLVVKGRKTSLTDIGQVLLHRAQYLLEEVSRIEAVADFLSSGVETELRIAVDAAFPQDTVFQALEKVSALFPQINIDLIDTILSGANELLAEGNVDIALSPLPMNNGLNDELCCIEFVAVAHKNHALHQLGHELSVENLRSFRQVIVHDSAIQNKTDAGWLGAKQRWSVSHLHTSIKLVENNMGYAWLPLPAIKDALSEGTLKRLQLKDGGSRRVSFYLNYFDKDRVGPAAREFMGELRLSTMDMSNSET